MLIRNLLCLILIVGAFVVGLRVGRKFQPGYEPIKILELNTSNLKERISRDALARTTENIRSAFANLSTTDKDNPDEMTLPKSSDSLMRKTQSTKESTSEKNNIDSRADTIPTESHSFDSLQTQLDRLADVSELLLK